MILKSYIHNSRLIFVLEVPLIEKSTYIYYKVVPVPIHTPINQKTHTIIPQYPFLTVNRLNYRPLVKACDEIEDRRFLCTEENLALYSEETCIEQLMLLRNNYTKCHQRLINIEDFKIQQLAEDQWLLYSRNSVVVTENCNEESHKQNLQGTCIIIPSQGC